MSIATYIRVSTEDQDQENQLIAIRSFAEKRGLVIDQIYSETASAWKNGHQKELSKLLADAKAGNIETLIVWSLDRLTREGPASILNLVKRLEDLKVSVISIQEPWTEVTADIKPLLLAVFGWIAEMESKRRSERTKAGILRRKQNGGHVGRRPGSKDSKKRKTDGYILRQAREKIKRADNGD
jgi:DNA invertase Pin-like site-specific DNA recombinase